VLHILLVANARRLFILFLFAALPAGAQSRIPELHAGNRIRATGTAGDTTIGWFIRATSDTLVLERPIRDGGRSVMALRRADLRSVDRGVRQGQRTTRGFAIGAVGGALAGFAVGYAMYKGPCGGNKSMCRELDYGPGAGGILGAVVGVLFGGAIGGAIGSSRGVERWIPVPFGDLR